LTLTLLTFVLFFFLRLFRLKCYV